MLLNLHLYARRHLEGLVKCQVARHLGRSARIEEEVCKIIAIAAEERLVTVLESLSEICNNHVDYHSTNSRIKVAKNQLADQLKFLEHFGEKNADGESSGAGAGAAEGAGRKSSRSGMDVDGAVAKASGKAAARDDDDDDDEWGVDIARPPKRRKAISAGDFAVWSAQNRMAGRQFKSQFRWHLGSSTSSGGDAAGGQNGSGSNASRYVSRGSKGSAAGTGAITPATA